MVRKARTLPVGCAVNPLFWGDKSHYNLMDNYRIITPEVAGWYYVVASRGWGEMDSVMEYARQGGKPVTYHCLRWWFLTQPLDIEAWITNAMTRYPDILDWIVVNEGWCDGLETVPMIEDSYRIARKVRPDARLWYNGLLFQASEQEQAKRLVSYGLADGVGIQFHININFDLTRFVPLLEWLKACRVRWRVTELDCEIPNTSEWCLNTQADVYENVLKLCHEYGAESVTVWGVDDGHSWLPYYPLPFGADYQPKPAWAILGDQ